ncbi:hypothetical protein [Ralstonia insidiosa]|uniref:hypothetical protein n=2 Tax=Ralstonia TaxID=48736 RepID=UPI0012E7E03A|nr:hypothetical protein [Ralstonia insidiosa]
MSGRDISRMLVRPLVSDAVAEELIDCLDAEARTATPLYRRILLRDKAMFLVARELRLDMTQLLAMKVSRQGNVKSGDGALLVMSRLTPVTRGALLFYLRSVRPALLRLPGDGALFISANGMALGRSAVGMRFAKAARITGLQDAKAGWLAWVRG